MGRAGSTASIRPPVEIGLNAASDHAEVTRLLLRPSEGLVALDNRDGSTADWARDDTIWAAIPAGETASVELVIDGAAVTGTIGERPFGMLAYPQGRDAQWLTLASDGPAMLEQLTVHRRR